jgi:diadenosine tetraphosphate (Ap4A) HIT family hydrolase
MDDFPFLYQLISDEPKYWYFVHNISPYCDFHCLLILKKNVLENESTSHVCDLGSSELDNKVFTELGLLLNKASLSIKACSTDIVKVMATSLNAGFNSKHLHFHLLPVYKNDQIKIPLQPNFDGGGMFFFAAKELVEDMLFNYIESKCGSEGNNIVTKIEEVMRDNVKRNVIKIKDKFHW